jgi:hypothetical protein
VPALQAQHAWIATYIYSFSKFPSATVALISTSDSLQFHISELLICFKSPCCHQCCFSVRWYLLLPVQLHLIFVCMHPKGWQIRTNA